MRGFGVQSAGMAIQLGEQSDRGVVDVDQAVEGLNSHRVTLSFELYLYDLKAVLWFLLACMEVLQGHQDGGIAGGISTGQPVKVRVAFKPTSSIRSPKRSIDLNGQPSTVETFGRHDPCVGIRATPIAEAMLALVLMDHALRHRGQNQDVVSGLPPLGARDAGH